MRNNKSFTKYNNNKNTWRLFSVLCILVLILDAGVVGEGLLILDSVKLPQTNLRPADFHHCNFLIL